MSSVRGERQISAPNLRGKQVEVPCSLPMQITQAGATSDTTLECTRILRLLPGRRMVCRATCRGQEVVAKLFIHPTKAKRDLQRELDGYNHLQQAEITTPQLIATAAASGGIYAVIYQYLAECTSLQQAIASAPDNQSRHHLAALMPIIAAMHNSSVQQIDLHLNNFLLWHGTLYTIDCGDISRLSDISLLCGNNRRMRQIHKNMADIMSQLPTSYDHLLPELIDSYRQHSRVAEKISIRTIRQHMLRWRKWRMNNYVKKSARSCSEFVAEKSWHQFRVYRRQYSSSEWLQCYANLDQLVEQSERLKDGNSATVALAECGGEKIVIKRYNIKNFTHLLSRFWRPSRAWRTWQNAQRLKVLGIRTPQPIAIIEKRFGYLRSQAFYVSAYDGAQDALSTYNNQPIIDRHLQAFKQLFTTMIYARISHGDFKGNNFLLDEKGLAVIDLDSMRLHRFQYSFNKAFARDIARFLRNWPENSAIYTQVKQMVDNLPK